MIKRSNKYITCGPEVTESEDFRLVYFTDDLSKVTPIFFELVIPTLGSKNREMMFKFIMKDSYFKIKTISYGREYRIEAKEVGRDQKIKSKFDIVDLK